MFVLPRAPTLAHLAQVGSKSQALQHEIRWLLHWLLCRLAYGLAEMDISNNPGLTGELLPQMGLLSRLKQVRTTNTNMSCAGVIRPYVITTNNSCSDPDRCITPVTIGNPETRYHACDPGQLLPCFLRFSDYMVPRDDDTNMRCKYIVRRPVEEARKLCSGDDETMLGDQAGQLPELGTDRLQQLWHVDPSYFQYQACECLLVGVSRLCRVLV